MKPYWQKLGLLYSPTQSNRHPKLLTHAANPLPVHLTGDTYRIFYSARDAANRSSVGAVDINVLARTIIQDHPLPFFEHGLPGSFFADGVSIGNCYEVGEVRYMLFMGWQNPPDEHWRGDIGRLIVHPDLTLSLERPTPFLAANAEDPLSLSYPWVMRKDDQTYQMWYGSTVTWDAGNQEMLHVIKSATSQDGHHWSRHGLSIPYAIGQAQAFSKPTVVAHPLGGYEMWFSYRCGSGKTYRIGYARSQDQVTWQLALDQAGIDVSTDGWDCEMIAYPYVFDHQGLRYMLYNGNGYGKTGFGLAVLCYA